MKKHTTMTYAVAAALAATLALAGCNGGEKDPTATPTSSTSSTTSASPSTSATPTATPSASVSVSIPADARANTAAGAMAFVRFWFEQANVAYTKPDPKLIPALSTSSCKSCTNLAEEPVEFAAKGYHMSPAPSLPLTNVKSLGGAAEGKHRVSFTISQRAAQIVDASGKVIESQEANSVDRIALVSWEGNRWLMDGLAAAA